MLVSDRGTTREADTLTNEEIRAHVAGERPRWTDHARLEAEDDGLPQAEVEAALARTARLFEAYPNDQRGASILVLVTLVDGSPVHVVVGIARAPWVIISVWRPDHDERGRWTDDYLGRRR